MKLNKFKDLPSNFFGKIFWNIFFAYLVIFLVLGILALLEIRPIEFNGEPTYGFVGFISAILITPLIALPTSFTVWILMVFGNFIMRLFVK